MDGDLFGLLTGPENEGSLRPDGHFINRAVPTETTDHGIDDLPVTEENPARFKLSLDLERTRFAGDAHQLDDVRQRQFTQRSLQGHGGASTAS